MSASHVAELYAAVQQMKSELNAELRGAVSAVLREFRQRHGVSPKAVRVSMVEVTAHGDQIRSYELGSVDVEFPV